jgi:hypothetical protein
LPLGIFAPAFLAVLSAIATDCFCGLPASISVLIFSPIAFLDLDLISGIVVNPYAKVYGLFKDVVLEVMLDKLLTQEFC